MKYLLFGGAVYYPAGGWDDLVGGFKTLGEAMATGKEKFKEDNAWTWFHIVDLDKMEVVVNQ